MNFSADVEYKKKPLINVGCQFDIPTGSYVTGTKGESILNGGVSSVTTVLGLGNVFKSTIMYYLMLSAYNHIVYTVPYKDTGMHTYDTEDNMDNNEERLDRLASAFQYIQENPTVNRDVWDIVAKSDVSGDIWFKKLLEFTNKKSKESKSIVYDGFESRITKKSLIGKPPNLIGIDSLSEFESEKTSRVLEEKNIDETQTLFLDQGGFKTRVIKELPRLSKLGYTYFFLVAHMGTKYDISSNPMSRPTKSMQYFKVNEEAKGIAKKLLFLSTHFYKAEMSTTMINQTTKQPEYPFIEDDVSTDLNLVKLVQVRSKTGPSGYTLEIVVSQHEGVLPELTNFHYIKTNKFGISGNVRTYHLDLYPEISLMRTTVRKKLKENKLLARAVEITSDLLQIKIYKQQYRDIWCEPSVLYEDIKKLGYDWSILLNSRGWYTVKQYETDIPFLSTLDLLRMRIQRSDKPVSHRPYHPYWLDKTDKTKIIDKHVMKG